MTFDDDFLQLEFEGGTRRATCKSLGIEWPPPETITVLGFEMEQVSRSTVTDEQRQQLTMLMRGARFVPVKNITIEGGNHG